MRELPLTAAAPSAGAVAAFKPAPNTNERLSHLFRASLKNATIHPLYLPILKYRQSRIDT